MNATVNHDPDYFQTKKKFCENPQFKALGALGLWYGYCHVPAILQWLSDYRTARMGKAKDCAAFCKHPHGFHIRRVLSDGKLLQVYENTKLLDDTLLPIAVPGHNIQLLALSQVVPFLKKFGAKRYSFSIRGKSYKGYVLEGKKYCAAWSDQQRGHLFETAKGPNPNAKILRFLP